MKLKNKKHLPLNLQFFGGEDDEGGTDEGGEPEKTEITDDELKKKIEAESDRKLNSALKKRQAEWDAKLQEEIDKALKEHERLSKLSDNERKQEQVTQREKELAEKEAELNKRELLTDAESVLREQELPTDFAEILLGEDAESTLDNIKGFKKAFDSAVNDAVKDKLRQDTPRASGGTSNKNVPTVAELAKEHRLIK